MDRAQANLFGAFSLFTTNPFCGPTAADGWDAVEFWLRGPDALSLTMFVQPVAPGTAGAITTDGAPKRHATLPACL